MTQDELRRLARIGAEARLAALQREIQSIYHTFPELSTGRGRKSRARGGNGQATAAVSGRRRSRMSAEARKRIADAQRKRWAEWRKKNSR